MKKYVVRFLVMTSCLYVTLSLAYGELVRVWFASLLAVRTLLINIIFDLEGKTNKKSEN